MTQAVYAHQQIGSPIYQGLTLGDVVYYTTPGAATFAKGDWPGLRAVLVECQGAGGGSGGTVATGAGEAAASAGGAGGGYARSLILAADLADVEAVTVPAGGTAGASGANPGGDGGDAVFDTIPGEVRGKGGPGGAGSGSAGASGSTSRTDPASGSAGDLVIVGGTGWGTLWRSSGGVILMFGWGGQSFYGDSRAGYATSNAGSGGLAGRLYGGGAGGSYNFPSQSAKAGAAGGQGIVIVTVLY